MCLRCNSHQTYTFKEKTYEETINTTAANAIKKLMQPNNICCIDVLMCSLSNSNDLIINCEN